MENTKKRMMSIRVSSELLKKIKEKIKDDNITFSKFLRELLKNYLYDNQKIDLSFDRRIKREQISFRLLEEDARLLHLKSFDERVRKTTILEGLFKNYLQN